MGHVNGYFYAEGQAVSVYPNWFISIDHLTHAVSNFHASFSRIINYFLSSEKRVKNAEDQSVFPYLETVFIFF